MIDPEHQKAQELAANAELARSQGDYGGAKSLYAQAAERELEAFRLVPLEKTRSRGILALSYASLLFKAEQYNHVESAIYNLLGEGSIPVSFHEQLRELLQIVWEEQVLLKDHLKYSGAEIMIALRGGKIGPGTAPADVAVHYLNGFNLLAYRVAECDIGLPIRRHGPPSKEIQAAIQARATQPVIGSYRFSIKLLDPDQIELFPEASKLHPPDAHRVSQAVRQVLRAVANNNQAALESVVPQKEYRLALARLARNIVPSGEALSEVEIRTPGDGPLDAIRLVPGVRKNVNETIRLLRPEPEEKHQEEMVLGTLRAVHLDNSWVRIVPDEGAAVEAKTSPDELDDVIGPMVNRKVIARVAKAAFGRKGRLLDIELQDD